MPERSADWLAQAERDLTAARVMFENGLYDWSCFAAQQTAEKAIKGLYQYSHGEAWGHVLYELLEGLPQERRPGAELIEHAKTLDRYYIQPRYPDGFVRGAPLDYFTSQEAEDAIAAAVAILRFCQSQIS